MLKILLPLYEFNSVPLDYRIGIKFDHEKSQEITVSETRILSQDVGAITVLENRVLSLPRGTDSV